MIEEYTDALLEKFKLLANNIKILYMIAIFSISANIFCLFFIIKMLMK